MPNGMPTARREAAEPWTDCQAKCADLAGFVTERRKALT